MIVAQARNTNTREEVDVPITINILKYAPLSLFNGELRERCDSLDARGNMLLLKVKVL
jgi:hypothetical protein